jgi:hypothetical protein
VLIGAEQRFPESQLAAYLLPIHLAMNRRYGEAVAVADSLLQRFPTPFMANMGNAIRAASEVGRGRLHASRRHASAAYEEHLASAAFGQWSLDAGVLRLVEGRGRRAAVACAQSAERAAALLAPRG